MHQLRAATGNAKVKELEEEVRRLTVENSRVKADLEKMQRRWERLKEGARRRRREGTAEEDERDKERDVEGKES
jgi:molecular chaperone GrpE (heat shock protein)